MPRKMKDLTGMNFGRWRVESFSHRDAGTYYWKTKCECGTPGLLPHTSLKSGRSKSCGCYWDDLFGIDGMRDHPLYSTVMHQISRCRNINDDSYKNYGGRGIEFRFNSLGEAIKYYETLGPKPSPEHTLDRLDTNGHYEIGNIGWSDKSEQNLNKRKRENTSSKFRGVCFAKKDNLWVAQIKWREKKFTGWFKSEFDAAYFYLEKYYEFHGKLPMEYKDTALLNFPTHRGENVFA